MIACPPPNTATCPINNNPNAQQLSPQPSSSIQAGIGHLRKPSAKVRGRLLSQSKRSVGDLAPSSGASVPCQRNMTSERGRSEGARAHAFGSAADEPKDGGRICEPVA